jgi:hypothetical protein
MNKVIRTKEEITQKFQALLLEQKAAQKIITTKEAAAELAKSKELVTAVAEYKPDLIVKGAAGLQLDFSTSVESLAEQLQKELKKLDELRAALQVENQNLTACNNAKIAADALHILKKEQEQQKSLFEESSNLKLENLEKEIEEAQKRWEKEEKAFVTAVEERKTNLDKNRTKELSDYTYELERKYKIGEDDYKERKKMLLRDLVEQQQKKDKDWANREKVLKDNESDFEKYKTKVDGFDKELEEETKKSKDKAIKEASRKAKVEMELYETEVEGKRKIAALQISELGDTIERQKERIVELNTELKTALEQVKALSLKALEK